MLPICTAISRPLLVELLDQVTSGDIDYTSPALQHAIFTEVVKAYACYVSLVQHGADVERSMCIDLLLYCARYDPSLRTRTGFYIERAIKDDSTSNTVRVYAANRLEFEKEAW